MGCALFSYFVSFSWSPFFVLLLSLLDVLACVRVCQLPAFPVHTLGRIAGTTFVFLLMIPHGLLYLCVLIIVFHALLSQQMVNQLFFCLESSVSSMFMWIHFSLGCKLLHFDLVLFSFHICF